MAIDGDMDEYRERCLNGCWEVFAKDASSTLCVRSILVVDGAVSQKSFDFVVFWFRLWFFCVACQVVVE
jgi:hypothetical protein